MADYFTPTVVQQTISVEDISPFERLLLGHIFDVDETADGFYFYSEDGPQTLVTLQREQLMAAIGASTDRPSSLLETIEEQLAKAPADQSDIDFDLSGTSYAFSLQDIVGRSTKLSYLSVVSSFTCSKMLSDGFGGMVVVITKDAIMGKSTNEILEEFLVETALEEVEEKPTPDTEGDDV